LPAGADAVLPLDQAELHSGVLEVADSLAPGDGVAARGEECRADEPLLEAGRRLRPQDLARLVLAGVSEVSVARPPRVRVVLAGRFERDADGPLLAALVRRDGGELLEVSAVQDQASLSARLQVGHTELILVAGGTGYASHDIAVQSLQAVGALDHDGVAIHPGGAVVLGHVGTCPVVLLPGAPLACLCAYDVIAARLLRRLAGRSSVLPYRQRRLTLRRKIVSGIGRMELARVKVEGGEAEPVATAEGRVLATAVSADGFLLVPEHSEGYAQGHVVDVYLYDEYD
jgi:molybdopterin molybdotransferase